MRLPKFELLQPKSLEEACAMAEAADGNGKVLAGGTDLLPVMKLRGIVPHQVINLKGISELRYVESSSEGLRIGSLTGLDTQEENRQVRATHPLLAEAVGQVASYQLRNMATIGGNVCLDSKCWYFNQSQQWWKSRDLCFKRGGDRCYVVKGGDYCHALSCADTVPALMVMGAQLRLVSSRGERLVAVEDFYTGDGRSVNVLQPGEVLAEIIIPPQPAGSGWAFIKKSYRGVVDFALVDVAVRLSLDPDGTCTEARIALNAVAPRPLRAAGAEETLQGQKLELEIIRQAAERAAAEARPVSSIWTSVYYRRRLIRVLTQRALEQAAARAKGGNSHE